MRDIGAISVNCCTEFRPASNGMGRGPPKTSVNKTQKTIVILPEPAIKPEPVLVIAIIGPLWYDATLVDGCNHCSRAQFL